MTTHVIVQLNIAKAMYPLESDEMSGFTDNLDRINQLAETSEGFIWRLQTEDGDATGIKDFGEDYIVNMSIWEDIPSLHNYVYRTAHTKIMAQKKQWFEHLNHAYSVLWWVKRGYIPNMEEAKEKIRLLDEKGPTPHAFTFKQSFPAPS